jgi:hypothetical protein
VWAVSDSFWPARPPDRIASDDGRGARQAESNAIERKAVKCTEAVSEKHRPNAYIRFPAEDGSETRPTSNDIGLSVFP